MKDLNAVFQPEKIGHAHGLQISYLEEERMRNLFVYHENGEVRPSAIALYLPLTAWKPCNINKFFPFWHSHSTYELTGSLLYDHPAMVNHSISDCLQIIVSFFNAIRATRFAYLQKKHPSLRDNDVRHISIKNECSKLQSKLFNLLYLQDAHLIRTCPHDHCGI